MREERRERARDTRHKLRGRGSPRGQTAKAMRRGEALVLAGDSVLLPLLFHEHLLGIQLNEGLGRSVAGFENTQHRPSWT